MSKMLLISTLARTVLCFVEDTHHFVQVGQSERKRFLSLLFFIIVVILYLFAYSALKLLIGQWTVTQSTGMGLPLAYVGETKNGRWHSCSMYMILCWPNASDITSQSTQLLSSKCDKARHGRSLTGRFALLQPVYEISCWLNWTCIWPLSFKTSEGVFCSAGQKLSVCLYVC